MEERNNRKIGAEKENLAADYLKSKGVKILCKNFRSRQGEIDIVGRDGEYLVFVEVKYRSSTKYDSPLSAVGITKQKQICKVADFYRCRYGISMETPIRYDVIGILKDEVTWIPNAFPHRYM